MNLNKLLMLDCLSRSIAFKRVKRIIANLVFALSAPAVFAEEYVIGLGYDDVFDQTGTQSAAVLLEYHANPFFSGSRADYSFAVAGQVDTDGDIFIGFGVHAIWSIGQSPWFIESSFMPGFYDQGSRGTPLDGHLQFRSLIGVGYRLTETSRISLAVDHKSNADREDTNPGSETLSLRFTRDF